MAGVEQLAGKVPVVQACQALGASRATVYRRRRPARSRPAGGDRPAPAPRRSPRRLGGPERQAVLEVLHSERFAHQAPGPVVATLMEEGRYLCSVRTMYRILGEHDEVHERRNQRRHPRHAVPRLEAAAPNQVWTWDITKLRGPVRGVLYYLYLLLDLYSRYAVGWTLASRETAAVAQRLIRDSCTKQRVGLGQLTVHSDRGAAATAKSFGQLLRDLDITRSLTRPRTSDDNPYSESLFKTLKYHPAFPGRFASEATGLAWCRGFIHWYNTEHRHSGIAYLTPESVHYGLADALLERRHQTLLEAYRLHPERFVHGPPRRHRLPERVTINLPPKEDEQQGFQPH